MESKFRIGDRVQATKNAPEENGNIHKGDQGTICFIERNKFIGVEWDKNVHGHDCGGKCENGHGWKVWESDLCLIEEEAEFDIEENSFMRILEGGTKYECRTRTA